jgi:OmpA-OmpF porin, OOP family
MSKTVIAGAVALISLASSSAFAQAYVGGNIGESHANRGCGATEAAAVSVDCDKNDFAWKLYGGYQLPGTPFAGEVTYWDLGKFKANGSGFGTTAKDTAWGLGGAYRPDFGGGWGGVARVGAAYGRSKVDYSLVGGGGTTLSGDHTKEGWHPYYGLGVNYALTKNLKLTADWDNTRITSQIPALSSSTAVVNTYSVGASWGF